VALVCRELMDAEMTARVGAAHGETSETRTTQRNGYRPRLWETRVGEIEHLDRVNEEVTELTAA
jgi:transposase-like protein